MSIFRVFLFSVVVVGLSMCTVANKTTKPNSTDNYKYPSFSMNDTSWIATALYISTDSSTAINRATKNAKLLLAEEIGAQLNQWFEASDLEPNNKLAIAFSQLDFSADEVTTLKSTIDQSGEVFKAKSVVYLNKSVFLSKYKNEKLWASFLEQESVMSKLMPVQL